MNNGAAFRQTNGRQFDEHLSRLRVNSPMNQRVRRDNVGAGQMTRRIDHPSKEQNEGCGGYARAARLLGVRSGITRKNSYRGLQRTSADAAPRPPAPPTERPRSAISPGQSGQPPVARQSPQSGALGRRPGFDRADAGPSRSRRAVDDAGPGSKRLSRRAPGGQAAESRPTRSSDACM
jgi:hypothetical protein